MARNYLPRAERAFGTMAQQSVDAFAVKPLPNEVDIGVRPVNAPFIPSERRGYLDLRKKQLGMMPIKPRRRHDFGSLTFDIG